MRFVRLRVGNFRAITSADLAFGPGLNVLYGPNDLGKSTLGVAVRAALLLPGTSAAAADLVPWQDDAAVPVVTLDLQDDQDRFWRVEKHFGKNDATLSFSKDGVDYTADAHERQVDEKLRKLLGWGIPGPGGRGGPKGMPESFLANALLAAQTDVDGILRSSLEADLETSGKLRLTKALAALASDPLVRHVLGAAQREHDQYFTATGQKKRGRNAPLTQASDEVKRLTDELLEKQRALHDAASAEDTARRLRERWVELQQHADALEQQHRRALAGRSRVVEQRAAVQRLEHERQALGALDARALEVKGLEAELTALGATLATREAEAKALAERVKQAAQAHRAAEDAARKASSAEGEAERAVARAALQEELARLTVARTTLAARLEAARAQQKVLDDVRRLEALQQQLGAQLGPARARVTELEGEAALITGIVNYGHWRAASEAVRQAGQLRADAQAARNEALQRTAASLEEVKAAKALEDEVAARRADFPDEKARAALGRLRREVELAEAALGGGVTVFVRPRSTLLLRSAADDGGSEEQKVTKEHVVEADRRVQLAIGDLVDIEVLAGGAEQRKDAEHLKKRWRAEGLPLLERAGVRTVQELEERVAALGDSLDRAKERRLRAAQLEREAENLRERSKLLDEKAAGAPTAAQLEDKRRLIGALPLEVLESAYAAMGASWESETRPQFEKTSAALADARATVARLEAELALTGHRLADAQAALRASDPGDDGGSANRGALRLAPAAGAGDAGAEDSASRGSLGVAPTAGAGDAGEEKGQGASRGFLRLAGDAGEEKGQSSANRGSLGAPAAGAGNAAGAEKGQRSANRGSLRLAPAADGEQGGQDSANRRLAASPGDDDARSARRAELSPGGLEQQLRKLDEQLRATTEQLATLEQARSGAVQQATAQLERATQQLAAVELEAGQAADSLARARATVHAKTAERELLRAQLQAADRPAVLTRLAAAEAHLATFADVEVLSDEALAARERALAEARATADQARSDAAAAEGALSRIGGPQAREQVRQLEEALALARARERHLEVDAEAWRLLVDAVKAAEQEDGAGLGAALATPVGAQFAELTKGRYPAVRFTPALQAAGLELPGTQASPEGMLAALSVGTRDHLATLVRLALALQLQSAIVLDDHLVHSDLGRLEWFRDALRTTAAKTQVLVLTCRPLDYVEAKALPGKDAPFRDVDARTRVVDLARVIHRR